MGGGVGTEGEKEEENPKQTELSMELDVGLHPVTPRSRSKQKPKLCHSGTPLLDDFFLKQIMSRGKVGKFF